MVIVDRKLSQATLLWADLAPNLESAERPPWTSRITSLAEAVSVAADEKDTLGRGTLLLSLSFYNPFKEFGVAGVAGQTASQNLPKSGGSWLRR